MEAPPNQANSRSSLVIERHYVPRTAPRYNPRAISSDPRSDNQQRPYPEAPSPGMSSVHSSTAQSPNGYTADYSVSEVSSLAGSVSSMPTRQHLDPARLGFSNQYLPGSGDMYSRNTRGYTGSTTSYGDTDADSATGDSDSRYRGELFQPTAAPRIIQKEVRQMYGEVHPKTLPPREDASSSGDDLDTMSEASIPSFTDVPRARPRASLRRKKLAEINSGFVSDDEASVSSQLDGSKSLPRGILKNNSTDISDAESLATSGNFRRTASGRTVRFQHNDKSKTVQSKKIIDYEKIDNTDSKSKKRSRSSSSDPFSVLKPVGIKPARNDPKRSSGRGSQRGRSSSQDRSRSSSRSNSMNRSRHGSGRESRSSSIDNRKRSSSADRARRGPAVSVSGEDVKIEMPESKPKPKSLMQELKGDKPAKKPPGTHKTVKPFGKQSDTKPDKQKIVKWCLIIAVPAVLLVVVIAVVIALFAGGG